MMYCLNKGYGMIVAIGFDFESYADRQGGDLLFYLDSIANDFVITAVAKIGYP